MDENIPGTVLQFSSYYKVLYIFVYFKFKVVGIYKQTHHRDRRQRDVVSSPHRRRLWYAGRFGFYK